MNRPGNACLCERSALQLATTVSAARATPTVMITDSVARESGGPRLPLSAMLCHTTRPEGGCQEGTDDRPGTGIAERRLQELQPGLGGAVVGA